MNFTTRQFLAASVIAVLVVPVHANNDDFDVRALINQIKALEARVAMLEAGRTFASFMPDFAERFHVMHRAGEAGDWAVASHELQEMKLLSAQSTSIDAEKGKLMQGMMAPGFEALDDAMKHANEVKFKKALSQTVVTCNACHSATGSGSIEVTLDVSDRMSLRHPHKLKPTVVPEGHTHAMPVEMKMMVEEMMEEMGHGENAGDKMHDDTDKHKHTD